MTLIQCSKIFKDVFDTHCSGCVRVCACGKVYYDTRTMNGYDWEEGEFEALENDPNAYPLDHSVGVMLINAEEIVIGCDCGKAAMYEKLIVSHVRKFAEYLNKRAESLRDEADSIEVQLYK